MTCLQLTALFASRGQIAETVFSYPGNERCVIGAGPRILYSCDGVALRDARTRYWAGAGCDVPGGAEYLSAAQLFEAPIFGGRSIRDRFCGITWLRIDGKPVGDAAGPEPDTD